MEKITGDDVRKMMIRAGWMHPLDRVEILTMDRTFKPADEKTVWDLINSDTTNENKYIPEIYDCDDFAFTLNCAANNHPDLMGTATGVLIIETSMDPNNPGRKGLHAIFCYCTEAGRIEAVEPQNDSPFKYPFKVLIVIMY